MRSCIGVRSCASSTITWPCGRSPPSSSALASSRSGRSASYQPLPRTDCSSRCSSSSRIPLGRGGERLRLGQQAADELVGLRPRPQLVERPIHKPPRRSAASMSSKEWYAETPEPRGVPLVERARQLRPQSLAPGRVARGLGPRLLHERGDLLRREPELDPFESDGEQLGRRLRQRARPPPRSRRPSGRRLSAGRAPAPRAAPARRLRRARPRRAAPRVPRRASARRARCSP